MLNRGSSTVGNPVAVVDGVEVYVSYRVLSGEEVSEALERASSSSLGGGWTDRVLEGWPLVEVNMTIVNKGSSTVSIPSTGPYCFWPFTRVYAVPDEGARLEDVRGESRVVSYMCQLALIELRLDPGDSHSVRYYYVVTPEYEGVFRAEFEVCSGSGNCSVVNVEAPVRVSVGG